MQSLATVDSWERTKYLQGYIQALDDIVNKEIDLEEVEE
jgi:hypothetical protein